LANEKILIVDDERGVSSSLEAILGEECLDAVAKGLFDAIMLDVWLPKMDGLEVLERLVASGYPGSIIMISGHGTIETAGRATKRGAFDFIEKPLTL